MNAALLRGLRLDLIGRRLLPIPIVLGLVLIALPFVALHRSPSSVTPAVLAPPAPEPPTAIKSLSKRATAPHTPPATHKTAPFAKDRDPFATTSKSTGGAGASPEHSATEPEAKERSGDAAGTPSPATAHAVPAPTSTPAPTIAPAALAIPPNGIVLATTHTDDLARLPNGTRVLVAKAAPLMVSTIDLRFGTAVVPKIRRDAARLTALPSAEHPVAILLGTRADRSSAVFQITAGVTVAGGGTCIPRKQLCSQLVLGNGQKALLTRDSDGKRLRLMLVRVTTKKARSLKGALHTTGRVSAAGRCAYDTVAAYEFNPVSGTLQRADRGAVCHYNPVAPKTAPTAK